MGHHGWSDDFLDSAATVSIHQCMPIIIISCSRILANGGKQEEARIDAILACSPYSC